LTLEQVKKITNKSSGSYVVSLGLIIVILRY